MDIRSYSTINCLLFCFVFTSLSSATYAQQKKNTLTVNGITLCETTVIDLKKAFTDLSAAKVEEMNLPAECYGQDSRFVAGKGFTTAKHPGIIFQQEQNSDKVSKIRLSKEFKGNLPDGKFIDVSKLTAKDVFTMYPALNGKWGSRGCSNHWHIDNDTLYFYVRIDKTKKPQYPIDEDFYLKQPVEAIDIVSSCYGQSAEPIHVIGKPSNEALFYLDSVRISRDRLSTVNTNDFALMSVYKNKNATDIAGPEAANGLIYIETKSFVRNRYWNLFRSKSPEYLKLVPKPGDEKELVYILNGKPLKERIEADLGFINSSNLISLEIINAARLLKDYQINNYQWGVMVTTNPKP